MPPPKRAHHRPLPHSCSLLLTPAHSLCVCLCLRHLIGRWFCVSCPPFAGSVRATRQSLQVAATHLARDADHRVRLGASCRPRASSSSKLRHLSVWPHSRRAREPRRAMYRIGRHTVAARVRLHHQDHQVLAVSPASQPPTLVPALEAAHPSAGLPPRPPPSARSFCTIPTYKACCCHRSRKLVCFHMRSASFSRKVRVGWLHICWASCNQRKIRASERARACAR